MNNIYDILYKKQELTREELVTLLSITSEAELAMLFKRADEIRREYCGDEIHLRGIIEFSNYCECNCNYCGLREDNFSLDRYRMTAEEIIETARTISNRGIRTIVLQSGQDTFYDTDLLAYVIYTIKKITDSAVTLSLGQRRFDEYRTWKIAGADRYLLKHESANSRLYRAASGRKNFEERVRHLRFLKNIGYQVGTGGIIGLPSQTLEDLADDILLCKELNADMAAFGPFIPSPFTPYQKKKPGDVALTLKLTAVARIVLKDAHIPATTALDTLDKEGREKGLNCGANVVMPNFTPQPYRHKYIIYPGKRGVTEDPITSSSNIQKRIEFLGRRISSGRGDSLKIPL